MTFSNQLLMATPLCLITLALTAQSTNQKPVLHLAGIGDSMTRGFNADGPIDHPWNSWSTGNSDHDGLFHRGQVKSHAEYLSDVTGSDVVVHNVAKTGARANDLDRQVELLSNIHVDYATLLIGANDLCQEAVPAANHEQANLTLYKTYVDNAVSKLIDRNPNIKILMAGLPDMVRLRNVGHGTSCQWRWTTFGLCPNLLGANTSSDQIAFFASQMQGLNADLVTIAAKYPSNVRYSDALTNYPFERSHVSDVDCFHPNIAGQNLLSQKTWSTGWWGSSP